jgi:choline dehydrogenase-like flavoprotein
MCVVTHRLGYPGVRCSGIEEDVVASTVADQVLERLRAWDVDTVFGYAGDGVNGLLADGSVCPTQGSANPALTIMALSSRLANRLAA